MPAISAGPPGAPVSRPIRLLRPLCMLLAVGQWLVKAAQVPAEAWVLDMGCGKGAVTIPAARAAGRRGT